MKKTFILFLVLFSVLLNLSVYADETNRPFVSSGVQLYEKANSAGTNSSALYYYLNNNVPHVFVYIRSENNGVGIFEEPTDGYYKKIDSMNTHDFNASQFSMTFQTSEASVLFDRTLPYPVNTGLKVYISEPFIASQYIFYDKMSDLVADMQKYQNVSDFIKNYAPGYGSDTLPLPTFKIKQALTSGESVFDKASVKYTFSWSVSEHEIYANNPNKYQIQMVATARYTQKEVMGTTSVIAEDLQFINPECQTYVDSAIPIYKESYSFLERTYREKLCDIAGVSKSDSSAPTSFYFLFVRVVDPEAEKSSLWKVYKCQGRLISPTGFYYDNEGNPYPGDSDDEIDGSTSYDSDPSTDDRNSPTSPNYNNGAEMDAQHLINNLEEIVNTLQGIPELFKQVFLWMPDYLIVLIATSIGLILVIGFVKMFLH